MLRLIALCVGAVVGAVSLSYGSAIHLGVAEVCGGVMLGCLLGLARFEGNAPGAICAIVVAGLATFAAFCVAANPVMVNYVGGLIVVIVPPVMISPVAGLYLNLKWYKTMVPLLIESVAVFAAIMQFAPST